MKSSGGYSIQFCKDDGGKSKSRHPKQHNDGVIRAMAIAFGLDYDDAYQELKFHGRQCSRSTPGKAWNDLLAVAATPGAPLQIRKVSLPIEQGQPRMNLARFCSEYPEGKYFVQMAKHVVSVVDGVVFDISRPDFEMCVHAVWQRVAK